MKRVMQVSALGVLGAMLLAGCGSLVGGLIPPVKADNALGLNGAQLASSPMQPLAVGANASVSRQFNNVSLGDTQGFAAQVIAGQFSIGSVSLSGCTLANSVTQFQIAVSNVQLQVSDSATSSTTNLPSFSLTVNNNNGALSLASATVVQFNLSNVAQTTAVATAGPQPNTATLSAALRSENNALQGCVITLGLTNSSLTFSNFNR